MIHAFADCELDDELFQLRRRGRPVKLEPKTFDVLAYLVRQRHRVVSKEELLDVVWAGVAVSESVLPKCVAAARRAVGDRRAHARIIETVHGRGYRFVASTEVRVAAGVANAGPAAAIDHEVRPSFVGRSEVLARLRSAFDGAAAGRGRVVLLTGEAGIGKTRTAEELAAEARGRGARVFSGRACEGEGAPAFWPWVQVLRGCARDPDLRAQLVDDGVRAPEIAALVPELGAHPSGARRARATSVPATVATDGEQARFRLFDGIATSLKSAAARQPLVILLEDLHWADAASLRLLRLLAGEIGDARLLILATCRDEDLPPEHPLSTTLGELARERTCEWIGLEGLQPAETAEVLAAVAGREIAPALAAAVHDMTEGNPFFVHELAQLLRAEGAPADPATLTRTLPQRVRDAIRRRIGMLRGECAQLLKVAAVLGREFDAPLLARVAELPPARVLETLADALAARILDRIGDGLGRYAFHHALIRQTLYDDLDAAERVRLHRRAGERLEEIHGADLDGHLDELALHFFAAAAGGDAERAVAACVRAGDRAYELLAYEQSGEHYARALEVLALLPAADESRRAEVLLALGAARSASGLRDLAQASFARVAAIARGIGRVDLLARAALGYRGPGEMGSPAEPTAVALVEDALAALGEAHPALRARLLSRLVGTPPYSNGMDTRERLSREAFALATRERDAPALHEALAARLWACLGPDRIDDRLVVARELLALAEREGSKQTALLAHDAALGAHLLRGEIDAVDRALGAYGRVAEELRQPAFIFQATYWQGSRALAGGDFATAERLFRTALARGRGTVPYAHFMFAGQMYPLIYLRGDEDDSELSRIFFGEMMELPYSWETAVRSAFAFSLVLRGQPEGARREFDALAERDFAALRRDEHWLVTLGSMSSVAVLLGDRTRAALLYDLLLPYADLMVVHDLLRSVSGSVAATLGHLATLLGRYDESAAHYEYATVKEAGAGTVLALLDSQAGYAHLLRLRNRAGDAARAASLLAAVRARMATLGIRRNWVVDSFISADDEN